MSSIKNIFFSFINPRKQAIWMIILVIIFISASIYGYQKFYLPWVSSKKYSDVANTDPTANANGGDVIIYFFSADWCPHCKTALPEWKNFSHNYNGKEVNGYEISCVNIDCTDDKDTEVMEYIKKYEIQGYPTIKMLKGDKIIDFDAKVTNTSLESFVKNMV
jgi:thiol-disulfide isomerase/thioredoxin